MATYTGTPRTWTAGETVTAALMNSDVRDPLAALAGEWNSYTPTLSQGASTDIAKTVSYAKYLQLGKLVIVRLSLAVTGSGTAASAILVTLPVTSGTASVGTGTVGSALYQDSGTIYGGCSAHLASTTTVGMYGYNTTGMLGITPAITAASGDTMHMLLTYESA